jgi:hypothetical protein
MMKNLLLFSLIFAAIVGMAQLGASLHPADNFADNSLNIDPTPAARYYPGHETEVH